MPAPPCSIPPPPPLHYPLPPNPLLRLPYPYYTPPPPAMPPPSQSRLHYTLACPNGGEPLATVGCHSLYGGGCPVGYACANGYCCPAACPSQLIPVGFCYPIAAVLNNGLSRNLPKQTVKLNIAFYPRSPVSSTCGGGGSGCYNGICCQSPSLYVAQPYAAVSAAQSALPTTCYSGLIAPVPCSPYAPTCTPGYECLNGGCCPLPNCPSGIPAKARCYHSLRSASGEASKCPSGTMCLKDLCCPTPTCPSGLEATVLCSPKENKNCSPGYEFSNGGCCPLPRCPTTGGLPYGR